MDDFPAWALSASRFHGIVVDDDVVALAELIYLSSARQLSALDTIDLELFPVRAIDPRHEPTA